MRVRGLDKAANVDFWNGKFSTWFHVRLVLPVQSTLKIVSQKRNMHRYIINYSVVSLRNLSTL